MNKLLVLCCDGLDYYEMKKYQSKIRVHRKLTIPEECFMEGIPYTPDIWGSFFLGRVWIHPDRDMFGHKMTIRLRIRKILKFMGISWSRRGKKFSREESKEMLDFVASNKVVSPLAVPNLLDNYVSFHFRVPSVSHGFYFGSGVQVRYFHNVFRVLLKASNIFNYEIFAIYTNLFDHLGHLGMDQSSHYMDLSFLMNDVKSNIVVLSDHATRDMEHKDYAYFGSNKDIISGREITSVIEIREIIEDLVRGKIY